MAITREQVLTVLDGVSLPGGGRLASRALIRALQIDDGPAGATFATHFHTLGLAAGYDDTPRAAPFGQKNVEQPDGAAAHHDDRVLALQRNLGLTLYDAGQRLQEGTAHGAYVRGTGEQVLLYDQPRHAVVAGKGAQGHALHDGLAQVVQTAAALAAAT